jgi:hypothetical protein
VYGLRNGEKYEYYYYRFHTEPEMNMRYRAALWLIVLLVFTAMVAGAGCAKSDAEDNAAAAPGDVDPSLPGDSPDAETEADAIPPVPATLEYGEPDSFIDNVGPLFTFLLYPNTGKPAIDREIEGWASRTYEDAKNEVEELARTASGAEGELNVQYNSYLVNDAYVGIEEIGSYNNTGMAHPEDFYKTFNIDIRGTGAFLANDQILDPSETETVLGLLSDKLNGIYPDEQEAIASMDASALENIVLTEDGVKVLMAR